MSKGNKSRPPLSMKSAGAFAKRADRSRNKVGSHAQRGRKPERVSIELYLSDELRPLLTPEDSAGIVRLLRGIHADRPAGDIDGLILPYHSRPLAILRIGYASRRRVVCHADTLSGFAAGLGGVMPVPSDELNAWLAAWNLPPDSPGLGADARPELRVIKLLPPSRLRSD